MDKARVNWFDVGYQEYSDGCGSIFDPDYGKMKTFVKNTIAMMGGWLIANFKIKQNPLNPPTARPNLKRPE